MDEKLDTKTLLNVFELIRTHGEASENGWRLDEITALSDHDGYTVVLKDDAVTLTVNFHNTLQYDYEHSQQLDRFVARIKELEQRYS